MRGRVPIRFGTYNIWNGGNWGIESALRRISQANMDLGIIQEAKLTDGIYTRGSAGYSVVATDAPSRQFGGLEVFYRLAPHFIVEAIKQFGTNVVSSQIATGERKCYIVGCYLASYNTSTIYSVVAALKDPPQGAVTLVARDFNANLSEPGGDRRGEDITAALAT